MKFAFKIACNFKQSVTLYSFKIYRCSIPSYEFWSFNIFDHEAWSEALIFCKPRSRSEAEAFCWVMKPKPKRSFCLKSFGFMKPKPEVKRLRAHVCKSTMSIGYKIIYYATIQYTPGSQTKHSSQRMFLSSHCLGFQNFYNVFPFSRDQGCLQVSE